MKELIDEFLGLPEDTVYPTKDIIIDIHDDIIEEDDDAECGILGNSEGGRLNYILDRIEYGYFGNKPETIHEKSAELMRLLASTHIFVDGNKRTALNTTATFYLSNGYHFEYGEDIKAVLKLFAVNEELVDQDELINYMNDLAQPIEDKDSFREATELVMEEAIVRNLTRLIGEIREKVILPKETHDEYTDDIEEILEEPQDTGNSDIIYYAVCLEDEDWQKIMETAEEIDFNRDDFDRLHDPNLINLVQRIHAAVDNLLQEEVASMVDSVEDIDKISFEEAVRLVDEFFNELGEDD